MNDENDKPTSDDWGMTMPHLRLEKNKNSGDFSGDFASNSYSANHPPASDFDKTSPNLNISRDIWQDNLSSNPQQSSGDDWAMTAPNIDIPREENTPHVQKNDDWAATVPNINVQEKGKQDDWGMSVPDVNAPKHEKQDDWSMPAPVFRVSEGEKVDNLPKRTINFNQNEADVYEKTTPNFNLSEISPPYLYGSSASPNFASQPQPNISEPFSADQSAAVTPKTERAASWKLIYLLGGLIATLFFAIVALALVYFLILRKPEVPQRVEIPTEKSKQTRAADTAVNVTEWISASIEPYPNDALSVEEFGEKNRVADGGHSG